MNRNIIEHILLIDFSGDWNAGWELKAPHQEIKIIGDMPGPCYIFLYFCFELIINAVIARESVKMYTLHIIEPVAIMRVSRISIARIVTDEHFNFDDSKRVCNWMLE